MWEGDKLNIGWGWFRFIFICFICSANIPKPTGLTVRHDLCFSRASCPQSTGKEKTESSTTHRCTLKWVRERLSASMELRGRMHWRRLLDHVKNKVLSQHPIIVPCVILGEFPSLGEFRFLIDKMGIIKSSSESSCEN